MTHVHGYDEYDRRFVDELTKLAAARNPSDAATEPWSRAIPRGYARATLASLRRALGKAPGAAVEAYPFVTPLLPPLQTVHDHERDELNEALYYLVASLFALHPHNWQSEKNVRWRTNFGASMARMKGQSPERSAGVERRFVALLNASFAELDDHLRHAISLLKSADIPVDWLQLLDDLRRWEFDDRVVQRRWARSFWGESPPDSTDSAGTVDEHSEPEAEE
jgi:CRISPR system Cascade subunit CasB